MFYIKLGMYTLDTRMVLRYFNTISFLVVVGEIIEGINIGYGTKVRNKQ